MRSSSVPSGLWMEIPVERQDSICTLCAEFAGESRGNAFLKLCPHSEWPSRVVIETSEFLVLPTIGPLVAGHLLICSRAHLPSIGAVVHASPSVSELEGLTRLVERRLTELYGKPCILFEHGPVSTGCRAGSCTDHAHLHIAPVSVDLLPHILRPGLEWREGNSLRDLAALAERRQAYMFYRNADGKGYVCEVNQVLPSQFLRQALALAAGRSGEWNWIEHPSCEMLDESVRDFVAPD